MDFCKKWVIFESVVAWVFVGVFDKSGDIGFWSYDVVFLWCVDDVASGKLAKLEHLFGF